MRSVKLLVLAGLVMAVGCSSEEESSGSGNGSVADCEAIIDACHDKDDGMSEFSVCHETAHDKEGGTDFSYCTANRARCVALCDAAPVFDGGTGGHSHGGAGGSAGSGTGGHSHGGAGGESHSGGTGGESHAGGTGGTGGGSHAGGTGGHSHGGAGGSA